MNIFSVNKSRKKSIFSLQIPSVKIVCGLGPKFWVIQAFYPSQKMSVCRTYRFHSQSIVVYSLNSKYLKYRSQWLPVLFGSRIQVTKMRNHHRK